MTDLQILPSNRAAIVGREPPSREYLRFFELLAKAYLQTGGAVADIAAIVARIEALENAGDISVVLKELENIAPGIVVRLSGNTWEARSVDGTATRIVVTDGDGQAGNPTIDLAELTDTGTGAALVKITRDDYGRVEGTEAATAADLPYDNGTSGLAATDVQAAIDEVKAIADAAGIADGDYGDVTVSGGGTVISIDAGVVNTTKLGGDITTAGKALLDDADNDAQRATLGLGTAATSAAADLLSRANHTGTQAASTISDFSEAVDDRVSSLLVAGTNITLSYNDPAGTLTINAAGSGGGGSGTATVDFGAFPGSSDASVTVTGQASILAGSLVQAWLAPIATADHSADEHIAEPIKVFAGNIVAGTGFTIYALNDNQKSEPLEPPGIGRRHKASTTTGQNAGAAQGVQGSVGGKLPFVYGQWSVNWRWE